MSSLYRVANWEAFFETYETKKLAILKWVPVPNKHDGLGFRRVAAQKNRCELFAAWNLILQVTSKGRKGERGSLQRGGRALTPEDLAMMTGFPADIFKTALVFFSSPEMGWLTADVEDDTDKTAEPPVKTAESRMETAPPPAEGNGREGKGKNTEDEPDPPPFYNEARIILHLLNEKSGSRFREVDANLSMIAARIKGVDGDLEGVKAMVERQCRLWRGDERMDRYLQPSTLFGPENFEKYWGAREKTDAGQSPSNADFVRKNESDFVDRRWKADA